MSLAWLQKNMLPLPTLKSHKRYELPQVSTACCFCIPTYKVKKK